MCTTNRDGASRTPLQPLKTLTFWIGPLDLHADARGVGEDVELLDPNDGATYPTVDETQPGNALGQGLDQIDVTRIAQKPDLVDQGLVADDAGQPVVVDAGIVADREIDIDADPLLAVALVPMDADQHIGDQIANEHPAGSRRGIGPAQRVDHGTVRHDDRPFVLELVSRRRYSSDGAAPGCAHPRC